jgi:transcriptional regulator with XRE-family HTH domain
MSNKLFARNLKFLMETKKVTKSTLTEHLKIKSSRVSAWLEGRAFPRVEQQIDLCNALGYYDLYKMFTVDLKKQKLESSKPLPAGVSQALKSIKLLAEEALI